MSDDEFEIKVCLGALLEHTLSPHPVRRMKKGVSNRGSPGNAKFLLDRDLEDESGLCEGRQDSNALAGRSATEGLGDRSP